MILKLRKCHVKTLMEEIKKSQSEICGLIFGKQKQLESKVITISPTTNILDSDIKFQVDPLQAYKLLLKAEKEKTDHLGFYHSHPALPSPSSTDIKYMKLWPDKIWLIISSIDMTMRAYIYLKEIIEEVRLLIIPTNKEIIKNNV